MAILKRSTTMVEYDYRQNINAKEARRRRVRIVLLAFFITIGLAISAIIYDALRPKTIISNTKPETAILGESSQQQVFDNSIFQLRTGTGWQVADSVPTPYSNYKPYAYIYRDKNDLVRRILYIFVDRIPDQSPINFVLPVEVQGSMIEPLGSISPRCNTLIRDPISSDDTPANWGGVNFMCKTDSSDYLVGAVHNSMGYGLRLPGTSAVHRYMFLYNDVSAPGNQRYDVFVSILRDFRVK